VKFVMQKHLINILIILTTDNLERYTDSDFQGNIEIRTQEKKDYNFLLIRPGEKKGKYILIIHEGNFEFSILGWFPFVK
jgi:hypothetical protein